MSAGERVGYDAFLSYSHRDATVAGWLHQRLERFARPLFRLRAMRIFRDTANLAMNAALSNKVLDAVDASRCFLLVASPSAAESPWVVREARHFLERGANQGAAFGIVLVSGQTPWTGPGPVGEDTRAAIAPALLELLEQHGLEPLVVDLRVYRPQRWPDRDCRRAIAQIAAFVLGRELDAVFGDHRRRNALRWGAVATTAVAVVATVGALAVHARQQRKRDEALRQAQARHDEALREADKGFAAGAFEQRAAHLAKAYALGDAEHDVLVGLARAMREVDKTTVLSRTGASIDALAFSPDGRVLTAVSHDAIRVWDLTTHDQRCHRSAAIDAASIAVRGDRALIETTPPTPDDVGGSAMIVDISNCQVVARIDGAAAVGLSDDGSRIATSAGRDIVVRDALGVEVGRATASDAILAAHLNSSGDHVVVATRDTLEMLAVGAPPVWTVREHHDGSVRFVTMYGGTLLAVVTNKPRTVRVFNLTGKLVAEGDLPLTEGGIHSVRAAGDAALVATANGGPVLGWSVGQQHGFEFPVPPAGALLSAISDACAAQGTPFIYAAEAASISPGVIAYEASSAMPVAVASVPSGRVTTLRFSPSCDRLAIAGEDGSLQVVVTQGQVAVSPVVGRPTDLGFGDAQQLIVRSTTAAPEPVSSPDGDPTKEMRRVLDRALHPPPPTGELAVETFAVATDGTLHPDHRRVFRDAKEIAHDRAAKRVVVVGLGKLRMYGNSDEHPVITLPVDEDHGWSVWFDEGSARWAMADGTRTEVYDGGTLLARIDGPSTLDDGYAVVDRKHGVELYDVAGVPRDHWHTPEATVIAPGIEEVCRVQARRDAGVVALAGCDGTVEVWDLHARKIAMLLSTRTDSPGDVEIAVDTTGSRLAVEVPGGENALYDAHTGRKAAVFGEPAFRGFCPTGELYALVQADGRTAIYKASDGQLVTRLSDASAILGPFGFSPDCRALAFARADRALMIYDLTTKRLVSTIDGPAPETTLASDVAWRPDGEQLFIGVSPSLVVGIDVGPERRAAAEVERLLGGPP